MLVNMPWGRTHSPSMGLGILKSVLAERDVDCDVAYLNLAWYKLVEERLSSRASLTSPIELFEIGTTSELYGEWIFSQSYFEHTHSEFVQQAGKLKPARNATGAHVWEDYKSLRHLVPEFIDWAAGAVDWSQYRIVGFTTMFSQLMASMCLARRLKADHPDLRIVMGGARCEGKMGVEVLRQFSALDAVFTGKAEESFPAYVEATFRGALRVPIPGIAFRADGGELRDLEDTSSLDLNTQPTPDFHDYFDQYECLELPKYHPKYVLIEASRGCYWGVKRHCVFCGLLGPRPSYNSKKPERLEEEIRELASRHHQARFMFADLIMNFRHFRQTLRCLSDSLIGFSYFCEIKPDLSAEQVFELRRTGCRQVQPGIESFSTAVLSYINKGASGISNVAALKYFREAGIIPHWNLIYGFPSECPDDYRLMVDVLRSITHLTPPKSVGRMGVVRSSPSHIHAEKLGFEALRPHSQYEYLFPFDRSALTNLCFTFEFDFADGRSPSTYTAELRRFTSEWRSQRDAGLLVYKKLDDGTGMIRDSRYNRVIEDLLLDKLQSAIYNACYTPAPLGMLVSTLRAEGFQATSDQVLAELAKLTRYRVLLSLDGLFLSLALTNGELIPWDKIAGLVPIGLTQPMNASA